MTAAEWDDLLPDPDAVLFEPPEPDLPPDDQPLLSGPRVEVTRTGPSYRVTVSPPGLRFVFRDVRTDGELSADVSVAHGERHLFRTTTTLSLLTRDRLAKTAAEFAGATVALEVWRKAVFAAVEAVLSAEETLGGAVDLRTAATTGTQALYVARPLWETGPTVVVGPGESGKSTLARAVAVSIAGNLPVLPGVVPVAAGPVLYVAGEAAGVTWHARSVEAICRGLQVDRRSLRYQVDLFDSRGLPIHRIARAIAERASDYAGVVLDPLSSFLAAGDQVRDRDNLFWRAVEQVEKPVLIVAHPNRAESRRWAEADGRVAGSEVNRDRLRLSWATRWQDEQAVVGTSFRRYTLENTKRNNGPAYPPLSFAASWVFPQDDGDTGVLRFVESEPVTLGGQAAGAVRLRSKQAEATAAAVAEGADTPKALAQVLDISVEAAKTRLKRLRRETLFGEEGDE